MNARSGASTPDRADPETCPERREHARAPIALDAQCRMLHARSQATVVEISTHGCKLVADHATLLPGNDFFVRMNGFDAMPGEVRWRSAGFMGVRFKAPLYLPVVEHIWRTHPGQPDLADPAD
ncbi:MAG: PilZ domain-containing protein [Sphingomonadales bacterium]|nr:PilZ domain-containing protein [Sphingomonadales bacterium]